MRPINVLIERHWALWENAATRLLNSVKELGLREKTIVLNTPWAELPEDLAYSSNQNRWGLLLTTWASRPGSGSRLRSGKPRRSRWPAERAAYAPPDAPRISDR